jgi:hypothetical protein
LAARGGCNVFVFFDFPRVAFTSRPGQLHRHPKKIAEDFTLNYAHPAHRIVKSMSLNMNYAGMVIPATVK